MHTKLNSWWDCCLNGSQWDMFLFPGPRTLSSLLAFDVDVSLKRNSMAQKDSWLTNIRVMVSGTRQEPSHWHSSRKPEKASHFARNWLGIRLHGWTQIHGLCGHSSPGKTTQPLSKPWAGWAETLSHQAGVQVHMVLSAASHTSWLSLCHHGYLCAWGLETMGKDESNRQLGWKCSCGHPRVSSLFQTASRSLGTTGSHHRHCRRSEEQQLLGKPMPAKICIWLQSQEDQPSVTQIMHCIILPRVFLEILFRLPDNSQTALVAIFGVDWQ